MLKDEQKRAAYDRYGRSAFNGGAGGPGAGGFGGFGGFDASQFGDMGDIFSEIFGGGHARSSGQNKQMFRGEDLIYDLDITLEQAAEGYKTKIKVPSWSKCTACGGSGAEKGTKVETCPTCHAAVMSAPAPASSRFSRPVRAATEPAKYIPHPCHKCHGTGMQEEKKELEITIPAGVDDATVCVFPTADRPDKTAPRRRSLHSHSHQAP